MTAQPEHRDPALPPMGTLTELRTALRTHGFPGDAETFEQELATADLDDLAAVRGIVQAYRHRVTLHCTPEAMEALARSTDDVEAELRRKLAAEGGR
ncbi:hypothetical protein ACPCSP_30690 [Streptomyces cinereoruber]|uniref:hypothetical protein n=1 Tax=Streptomyces cinereoruber TaxID=67260 RepID=UPI003C302075